MSDENDLSKQFGVGDSPASSENTMKYDPDQKMSNEEIDDILLSDPATDDKESEVDTDPYSEGAPKLTGGKLSIQSYVRNVSNMGLEKYKFVVYPNTLQREPITCIQEGQLIRYVTGLDENAPEIQGIKDPTKRKAAALNIRHKVAYLENRLKNNYLDVNDKDFWSKVELLRPDNVAFWEEMVLDLGNKKIELDPVKKPTDYIKLCALEAGGYSLVAPSWEDARSRPVPTKWYLDRESITVKTRTESKKIKNRALRMLEEIHDSDSRKLMLVAKVTDIFGYQYKYSTPRDVMYENMDAWINGEGGDDNYLRAAKVFIENCELSPKELKLKALCRDAGFYKILATRGDSQIYYMKTNTPVGRNMEEAANFFGDPVNQDMLEFLIEDIEKYWKE